MQPAGQKHAERLVRKPALEGVDDQEMPGSARESLDQHLAGGGNGGALGLHLEPLAHRLGQRPPLPRICQHGTHAHGKVRGERELAALVGGDHRLGVAGAGHVGLGVVQALEAQNLAGKGKGVADAQLVDEVFLQLAQHAPAHEPTCAARLAPSGAATHQPDLDHRRLDDGADVHAVLLREARMGKAQTPLPGRLEPA